MSYRSPSQADIPGSESSSLVEWFVRGSPSITEKADWPVAGEAVTAMPANARDWLFDSGSLTARLKTLSEGKFAVEVVDESWLVFPELRFRSRFGPVAPGHRFWSRRVVLLGNGVPWVFANTLIPTHSLGGDLEQIIRLGTRPLGEYLFSQPELSRSEIEVKEIAEQSWGRRSWFFLNAKPVLVAEYFLPALLRQIPPKA
ncbi:MAG: chorismate lyase [Gammaproteobacteria bacterium]|nr:chorismate lyase [Gammaproteobacteria bacterium]